MMEFQKNRGINFLKPLLVIASCFALTPPYKINKGFRLTLYKLYAVFLALMIAFLWIAFLVWYIYNTNEQFAARTLNVLQSTLSALLLLASASSTVLNAKKFQLLTTLFHEADKNLKISKPDMTRRMFLIELCSVHFLFIGLSMYSCYVLLAIFGATGIQAVVIHIRPYFIVIVVMLIRKYGVSVKLRFSRLNDQLKDLLQLYLKRKAGNYFKVATSISFQLTARHDIEKQIILERFLSTRLSFNKMCKAIKILNTIFGWQILFFFGTVVVALLQTINSAVIAFESKRVLLYYLLWLIVFMVMSIIVTVTCDKTTREGQRTATVCYNLLLHIPTESNNVQDRILREELILLAEQATHQCPYFTAAGFFNVDYSMLFGLLGTVTTYVIVLLQINA